MKTHITVLCAALTILSCKARVVPTESPKIEPVCQRTEIILMDGAVWTLMKDERILEAAKVRCGQKFKNSPCVNKFIKLGNDDTERYHVICGSKK